MKATGDATTDSTAAPATDIREQPWKKFMEAEQSDGEGEKQIGACEKKDGEGKKPWVGWQPSETAPFDKPWLKWSLDFGIDNFRYMSGT